MFLRSFGHTSVGIGFADRANDVVFFHNSADSLQVKRYTKMALQRHLDLTSPFGSILVPERLEDDGF